MSACAAAPPTPLIAFMKLDCEAVKGELLFVLGEPVVLLLSFSLSLSIARIEFLIAVSAPLVELIGGLIS